MWVQIFYPLRYTNNSCVKIFLYQPLTEFSKQPAAANTSLVRQMCVIGLVRFDMRNYVLNSQKNYADSSTECCKYGMRLLSIETLAELQCIADLNTGSPSKYFSTLKLIEYLLQPTWSTTLLISGRQAPTTASTGSRRGAGVPMAIWWGKTFSGLPASPTTCTRRTALRSPCTPALSTSTRSSTTPALLRSDSFARFG